MVRQTVAPTFVISMAVAAALMTGSGFTEWAGVGFDIGLSGPADALRTMAHNDIESSILSGIVRMIGLAITAISMLVETFIWVFLFPEALTNLGLPRWFSYPVGLPVLYVNIIGTISILRGFNIR